MVRFEFGPAENLNQALRQTGLFPHDEKAEDHRLRGERTIHLPRHAGAMALKSTLLYVLEHLLALVILKIFLSACVGLAMFFAYPYWLQRRIHEADPG